MTPRRKRFSYHTIGRTVISAIILMVTILLVSCQSTPAMTPALTNTPIPPTDTPVPPTETPVPPTPTQIPPTATPLPPTDTSVPSPWQIKENLIEALFGAGVSVVDGKIYVIGGGGKGVMDSGGGQIIQPNEALEFVQIYDPSTDAWSLGADMPTPRSFVSASAVDGKIYVFGGSTLGKPFDALVTVEVYDPATDSWDVKPDMPTPRRAFSSYVIDEKIYVFGGDMDCYCTVEVYHPKSESWERKADMPSPRDLGASAIVDGKVYLYGGMTKMGFVDIVDVYDPVTDNWTQAADMLTPRFMNAGCSLNGMIYTIGGERDFTVYMAEEPSSVVIYDTTAGEWKAGPELPAMLGGGWGGANSISAVTVDNTIYVIGGEPWGAFGPPSPAPNFWAYTPEN